MDGLEQKIGIQDFDRQDVIEKWMINALGSDYKMYSRFYRRATKTHQLPLPLFVRKCTGSWRYKLTLTHWNRGIYRTPLNC